LGVSDYKLVRLPNAAALPPHENDLLNKLFGDKPEILISELPDDFYKTAKKISDKLYQDLTQKGYFAGNPNKIRIKYSVWGGVLIVLGFFLSILLPLVGLLGLIGVIPTGILLLVFAQFMPALTAKGAEAKRQVLGLKEYITVAEKDRLAFHNAPELNPTRFEKLLPFAMVLGVEKAWARQFEGIYNQNPSWYSDPSMGTFSAIAFSKSLNGFAVASTQAVSPSSAATGGSGFSGGGAGGGFGGGGGGSW